MVAQEQTNMKKYICPNCGFKYGVETTKNSKARICNNCGAQVYTSKVVLESMMRLEILSKGK